MSLQEAQVAYDDLMWDIQEPVHAKLRHIEIHLAITLGKLAKVIEPDDHKVHRGEAVETESLRDELAPIVADLLMHSAQIANLAGGELGEFVKSRYRQNALRFAPASAFAKM